MRAASTHIVCMEDKLLLETSQSSIQVDWRRGSNFFPADALTILVVVELKPFMEEVRCTPIQPNTCMTQLIGMP
jgi:hypothetical protein